jgi:hypothetical protein
MVIGSLKKWDGGLDKEGLGSVLGWIAASSKGQVE